MEGDIFGEMVEEVEWIDRFIVRYCGYLSNDSMVSLGQRKDIIKEILMKLEEEFKDGRKSLNENYTEDEKDTVKKGRKGKSEKLEDKEEDEKV